MNTCKYVFIFSGLVLSFYVDLTYTFSLADAKCHVGPFMYPEGTFPHPTNSCSLCECHADGSHDCQSICTKPQCGKDLYRSDNTPCNCTVCSRICENINPPCPDLKCQNWQYHFNPNSCCPECRCLYEGVHYEKGRFGNPCDNCRCNAKWQVWCQRPACPAVKLQCVDPIFDKDCNYICPNGKTCGQGRAVIKYGEFKRVGNKVCTCVGTDWYPRAFCAKRMHLGDDFEKLMKRRCVADPSTFLTWTNINGASYK